MSIKTRYWVLVALIAGLAGLALIYFARTRNSPVEYRYTLADNSGVYMKFLRNHLLELTPSETKVKVVQRDINTGSRITVLSIGESLVFPDDEGSTMFTLTGIDADGADFKFESSFYLMDRRYIDVKQGSFKLYWFSNTVTPTTIGVAQEGAR